MSNSPLTNLQAGLSALAGLALVIPQFQPGQISGYQPVTQTGTPNGKALLFHYEGENVVTLTSDITDHWAEDNTSLQDQIALKPEEITVQGFIGELNDVPTGLGASALNALKIAANGLTSVSAYVPGLSVSAQLAYNEAFSAYQEANSVATSAISAVSTLTGGASGEAVIGATGLSNGGLRSQGLQQSVFQQFYGYWSSRTLFYVQTPWAVFQNMAIKNIRTVQDEQTKMITEFNITFKIMRFASSLTATSATGRAANQLSTLISNGTQALSPSATAFPAGH